MAKGSVRKKGKKWYGRFYIKMEAAEKYRKSLQAQKARRRQKPCSAKR